MLGATVENPKSDMQALGGASLLIRTFGCDSDNVVGVSPRAGEKEDY